MRQTNKKTSFEEFVKRTKMKDMMAAAFWYRMFQLSGRCFNEWIGESK